MPSYSSAVWIWAYPTCSQQHGICIMWRFSFLAASKMQNSQSTLSKQSPYYVRLCKTVTKKSDSVVLFLSSSIVTNSLANLRVRHHIPTGTSLTSSAITPKRTIPMTGALHSGGQVCMSWYYNIVTYKTRRSWVPTFVKPHRQDDSRNCPACGSTIISPWSLTSDRNNVKTFNNA